MNNPLCHTCKQSAKTGLYTIHYLPPYIENLKRQITCIACGETKEHACNIDITMPQKTVRIPSYGGVGNG